MAWLNIYQTLKQAIQDVIAPEMQQLRGDIKALSARMDSFEKSVDARFDAIGQRFETVDQRFKAMEQRFVDLTKRMDDMAYDWRRSLDIRERISVSSEVRKVQAAFAGCSGSWNVV